MTTVKTYKLGEVVEVRISVDADGVERWETGTIYRPYTPHLYQVSVPGLGFVTRRDGEIRSKKKEGQA